VKVPPPKVVKPSAAIGGPLDDLGSSDGEDDLNPEVSASKKSALQEMLHDDDDV